MLFCRENFNQTVTILCHEDCTGAASVPGLGVSFQHVAYHLKSLGRFSDSPRCKVPSSPAMLFKNGETLYDIPAKAAEENYRALEKH